MNLTDLQEMVDAASIEAAKWNMTIPIIIPDGSIIRGLPGEKLTVRSHVFLTTPSGADRSWRIVGRGLQPGDAVVEFVGDSYSAGIRGLSITYADAEATGITGIRTTGKTKNALIENVHINLWERMDCVGLEIRGHESVIVRRLSAQASVPLMLNGGDNHGLTDLDLTAANTEDRREKMNNELPSTCVLVAKMPNQIQLGGSFTAQGGDHAIYGRVDSNKTGQVFRVDNLRYEQSLSVDSEDKYVIDLKFTDRALERLVLIGCRWGENRKKGVYVTGCWDVERIGCYLHGTYWWRRD